MSRTRIIVWSVLGFLAFLTLLWAFSPRPVPVDLVEIGYGPMEVSISDDGEARVKDLYLVSAPASGYLQRIELEPGDCVRAGETRLGIITAAAAPSLDTRTTAQLRATAQSARAALRAADADVRREKAQYDQVSSDFRRVETLAKSGTVSAQALERAQSAVQTHLAMINAAEAARELARSEVARADAALIPATPPDQTASLGFSAPVSGLILQIFRDSEGPIQAGTPLLAIGEMDAMEVIVDILSEDAVQISIGDRARIRDWGGEDLAASVRRVDPVATTKVSALGIEEQRTNVVLDISAPQGQLGHGYRVQVDIITWTAESALQVPLSALFKRGDSWAVFLIEKGRAQLTSVDVGQLNGQTAEILSGLSSGDLLVMHPSAKIRDSVRIKPRQTTMLQAFEQKKRGPSDSYRAAEITEDIDPCFRSSSTQQGSDFRSAHGQPPNELSPQKR